MNEEIQSVHDQNAESVRQRRADGRKEKGIQLEKHIIGIDLGKVYGVGNDGDSQRRNGGQEKLPCLCKSFIGMIARFQHDERAENDGAVVQERVESREGYAGIIA